MNPEPSCYPSVNDPYPHCPVLLITPPPLPPTTTDGLVVPVDGGAVVLPVLFVVLSAVALAMRWVERRAR